MSDGRIIRLVRRWTALPPGRQRRTLLPARVVAWLYWAKRYTRSADYKRQQSKHVTCAHELEEFFPGMWKCRHGCGFWESRPLE